MMTIVLWKAYPLIMAALAILAVTKFRFLQHKQANTVLALFAFALSSTLISYGYIVEAVISNLIITAIMLLRSFQAILRDNLNE